MGAGCLLSRDQSQFASVPDLSHYNPRGYLVLDSGERVPFVSNAGIRKRTNRAEMPIVEGRVGNTKVETLRDTGCSGVIIKQQFVREDQYTGEYGFIQLVDNTVRRVPIARVEIDTPYLSGTVEALCLQTPICVVIIGNVPGARRTEDPDANHHLAGVVTRAQARLGSDTVPLRVPEARQSVRIDRERLMQLQRGDYTIKKYRQFKAQDQGTTSCDV